MAQTMYTHVSKCKNNKKKGEKKPRNSVHRNSLFKGVGRTERKRTIVSYLR
jgi:hypothetical protein